MPPARTQKPARVYTLDGIDCCQQSTKTESPAHIRREDHLFRRSRLSEPGVFLDAKKHPPQRHTCARLLKLLSALVLLSALPHFTLRRTAAPMERIRPDAQTHTPSQSRAICAFIQTLSEENGVFNNTTEISSDIVTAFPRG